MKTIDYYTQKERAEYQPCKEYTPLRRFYAFIGFGVCLILGFFILLAVVSSMITGAMAFIS